MTTTDVIKQFLARKSAHTPYRNAPLNNMWKWRGASLTSDSWRLISYETPIARWRGDVVLIDSRKYSTTTSKQQSMLKRECEKLSIEYELKEYGVM